MVVWTWRATVQDILLDNFCVFFFWYVKLLQSRADQLDLARAKVISICRDLSKALCHPPHSENVYMYIWEKISPSSMQCIWKYFQYRKILAHVFHSGTQLVGKCEWRHRFNPIVSLLKHCIMLCVCKYVWMCFAK